MKFQVATEPTQLEIKTLIESLEANNGLLVDNVGKKYLPVMNDIYDFRTIEGENSLAPLQESLKTKFPDLASSINVSDIIQKYHIENNIHFMYYNSGYDSSRSFKCCHD
ncbi:hypothetical protein [Lysinibacillus sp. C5.1]|uniref:hypothetical protein n=1 Tax=Lysinibacillus sp. C5.1 TaxID=2796169 RepID=UPI003081F3C5